MKYAIFTVSMPNCTPLEAITKIKNAGGHGVEWRITDDKEEVETPSFWKGNKCTLQDDWSNEQFIEVAKMSKDAGLVQPNLGTYARAEDLDKMERMMEIANIMEAPSFRINFQNPRDEKTYQEIFETAREEVAKVVEMAKKYKVKPLIEIHHGTIVTSASLAERFVSAFSPDEIGVIYDPGNMVHEGFENYKMGMEILGDYLAHIHVKSAIPQPVTLKSPQRLGFKADWGTPRAGAVNFIDFFKAMKSVGYDGWLSIEDFSTGMDEEWIIKDSFDFLNEMAAYKAE